jgi:hypothetical protein
MQPWTLSMAAYAALVAARLPGISPAEADADRALARKLIERLADSYLRYDGRVMLTPAMLPDPARGVGALDSYAAEVPYAGLTLLGLEWASREPDGTQAAEAPAVETWGRQGPEAISVLRGGSLWAVLRGARSRVPDRRGDLGPIAAKQLMPSGEWNWIIPPRPGGKGAGPDSWLVIDPADGGSDAVVPSLARTRIGDRAAFQTVVFPRPGERSGDIEIEFSYSEAPCGGLRIEFAAIAEQLEMNLWLPGADPVADSGGVSAGGVRAESSRRADISASGVVTGPANPDLTPVTFAFEPSSQPTAVTVCHNG